MFAPVLYQERSGCLLPVGIDSSSKDGSLTPALSLDAPKDFAAIYPVLTPPCRTRRQAKQHH